MARKLRGGGGMLALIVRGVDSFRGQEYDEHAQDFSSRGAS